MEQHFISDYEEFIYKSRYSRWLEEEKRREEWPETVDRYIDYMVTQVKNVTNYVIPSELKEELRSSILSFEIMPSMRALMTAGPALARDNTAGYNCSYLPIDDAKAFDEAMYILLCGTGVGFSVERQYVQQLPEIPNKIYDSATTIVVHDSKEGWAKALRQLIALLYSGEAPKWDTSRIRPAGARLKVFGGRASGPEPLIELFEFVTRVFKGAVGRKLTSLECHDILCYIGMGVVVGGVRRSAMISLSNLSDDRMRTAKSGAWWEQNNQRALANNSACYTEKPDVGIFLKEWLSLYESKSGERGIFSREASQRQAKKNNRRDTSYAFGTNPCSEIILRPYQFCNLTEIIARRDDTYESLIRKVKSATILGTFQSTLTYFPYLRDIWRKNTEEERLLGVSLTGIMDNPLLAGIELENITDVFGNWNGITLPGVLEGLRNVAVETNKQYAQLLDIPQSTAITCVKPSGTVSQLVNSASGIHTRHSPYYIRSVRADIKDPLTQFLKDSGIPWEPDVMKPDNTVVFYFPQKVPENAITRNDLNAIEQLELWKTYQEHWCEHKPSVTITVREEEWPRVGAWIYDNFDLVSGISFLPHSDHTYKQAPYQECTEQEYLDFVAKMPKKLDWSALKFYEYEDNTVSSQTLACVGNACEIIDISN